MVKEIINEIIEKYFKYDDEYYGEYRYDSEGNEFNLKKADERSIFTSK